MKKGFVFLLVLVVFGLPIAAYDTVGISTIYGDYIEYYDVEIDYYDTWDWAFYNVYLFSGDETRDLYFDEISYIQFLHEESEPGTLMADVYFNDGSYTAAAIPTDYGDSEPLFTCYGMDEDWNEFQDTYTLGEVIDMSFYDSYSEDWYDDEWYDEEWYDEEWYDEEWYDEEWYDDEWTDEDYYDYDYYAEEPIELSDDDRVYISAFLTEYYDISVVFFQGLAAAENGKAIADTIMTYADEMQSILVEYDRMTTDFQQVLNSGHPDFYDMMDKFDTLGLENSEALDRMWEFMDDPAVGDAWSLLNEIAGGM